MRSRRSWRSALLAASIVLVQLAPARAASQDQSVSPASQADTLLASGDFSAAVDALSSSAAAAHEADDTLAEANALDALALVYRRSGDARSALVALQDSLALRQQQGDPAGLAGTFSSLGDVYHDLGQYAQALDAYRSAMDLDGSSPDQQGKLLVSIGAVYFDQGRPEPALASFNRGLDLVRAVADPSAEATVLSNIGVAEDALGRSEASLAAYQQALTAQRASGNRWGEATVLANQGVTLDRVHRFGEAQTAERAAQTIFHNLGDRRSEGVVLANLGMLEDERGRLEQAHTLYGQAIQIHDDLRSAARLSEFKASLDDQATAIYERAVIVSMRLGRHAEAFELSERGKARAFVDRLGNAHLDLTAHADPSLVASEQALRLDLSALETTLRQQWSVPEAQRDRAVLDTLSARRDERRQQYASVLTQLELTNPDYTSLVSIPAARLADVQRALDAQTTLVSYFVTPDETLAFVVTAREFHAVELPVTPGDLQAALGAGDFSQPDGTGASLGTLYDQLVRPIRSLFRTPLVGFAPHKMLQYVPFAALWDGQGYVGDGGSVFEVPSASAFSLLQQHHKSGPATLLALGVGQTGDVPPLQFADEEASSVAAQYGAQPLLDDAATETAIKTLAGQYRIVHIAAHAELSPTSPLFSRLLLAADDANDGLLDVADTYSLDLSNTDLVVLSACQSGIGTGGGGDDLVGLARAFLYAGAPSLVASLWNVNDRATASLMQAFYAHLRTGQTRAEALWAAQTETRANYPAPYYWAPFIVIGEPGPVSDGAP